MLDLKQLGSKLKRYREQFSQKLNEVSEGTGIATDTLLVYEQGEQKPSGDDILILADYFKCDYTFLYQMKRQQHLSKQKRYFVDTLMNLQNTTDGLSKNFYVFILAKNS